MKLSGKILGVFLLVSCLFVTKVNAAKNWVYTNHGYNKLYPNTRTTNKINSAVDLYSYNGGENGTVASTTLFKRVNGNPEAVYWSQVPGRAYGDSVPTESWLFSEIRINVQEMEKLNFEIRQGTMAHEFGYAWGLGHN